MSLQKGLVGHWPLDNDYTANGTTKDLSGHGNHGTMYGGVTTGVSSPVGDGHSFDGTDDRIDVPSSPPIESNFGKIFTFSIWFRPETTGVQFLFDKDSAYSLFWDRGGNQQLNLATYGGNIYYGPMGIDTGSWHHTVAIWDQSNNTVSAWVDGVQYLDNEVYGDESDPSPVELTIGANSINGGNEFNGQLTDVRIYDRALSDAEIKDLYRMNAPQRWRL